MADDVQITAGSGTVIATDEVSSRHYQLIKPAWGADGSATLVATDQGLPMQAGSKVVTGSAAANNTDLVSVDVSGYRSVSVQITGSYSATAQFEVSNDNSTWVVLTMFKVNSNPPLTSNTSSNGIFVGSVHNRYFRVRTAIYASGTMSATVFLSSNPDPRVVYLDGAASGTTNVVPSGTVTPSDGNGFSSLAIQVWSAQAGWNGASWDRWRNPNVVKTVAATASGNTALWAPGSGNRWRLQRVKFDVTGDAAISSGGVLTIELRDGASTAINVTQSVYVPGTGGTALGGWSSGWIDLGNGIRASADNQDLNVNLSAALTAGTCRVVACGTQGSGTAT